MHFITTSKESEKDYKSESPEPRSIFGAATKEEKAYFVAADRVISSGKNRFISNGKPAHAVYLIYRFLREAKQQIKITTTCLQRTFDDVLAYAEPKLAEAAIDFLNRGGELQIFIQETPDLDEGKGLDDHPFLASVSKADLEHGSIKVYLSEGSDKFPYDFMVMDRKSYRFELDPAGAKAYVEFEDRDGAETVDSAFKAFTANMTPAFAISSS